ncbi:MAG: NUDIX hydrolase [Methylobacter sp.]|uniref:NUDIX hydrolase n=1 Tax=Methylobacter sp. TaxID=2051955 RepID=UPI00272F5CCD|nr:NUDIX hydrolase [Methylobacter sp.]MDP1663782.1 NUDIX hydrolase [Methylobacter sp.]
MSANLIQALISHLPRYAEEEGDFYSVPREALINALCRQHQLDRLITENTINLIETLLDTLAVLNTANLQKGEWCFISFPAQLLATSLLTAMSDNESRFFADNFWNTQGIADAKKNQQREVLSIVEDRRYEHHSSHSAKPIRYIYVAWGIIKLDGNILFYQREDTQKRFDKKAGDYGLIGGRLNQHDVPGDMDMPVLLVELQSANSGLIKQALPDTLKREISEEVGLVFERHFRFKPWRSLKPYRQVQGSAPNHALTEYYLDIFQVELTLEGYLFLQQQIKRDDRLVWFAIDDVAKGETVNGKIAYVKALVDDFDDDRLALKTGLLALPDSFSAGYLFDPPKYGLTLLIDAEKPLLAGALGKEKPFDLVLTPRQLSVLLGLAAHCRGFEFATVEENIIFHPYGWIDVKNNPMLQAELKQLAELFKGTDLIIENHHDVLFRLSINPDVVYFDEALFTYSVHNADLIGTKTKIPVSIERKAFAMALGMTKVKAEVFNVTLEFAHKLQQLSEKQFSSDNEEAVKIEDTYKKGLHRDSKFSALGLRGLIRREAGVIKFCCKLDVL